jgi:hypothetical protein
MLTFLSLYPIPPRGERRRGCPKRRKPGHECRSSRRERRFLDTGLWGEEIGGHETALAVTRGWSGRWDRRFPRYRLPGEETAGRETVQAVIWARLSTGRAACLPSNNTRAGCISWVEPIAIAGLVAWLLGPDSRAKAEGRRAGHLRPAPGPSTRCKERCRCGSADTPSAKPIGSYARRVERQGSLKGVVRAVAGRAS